MRKILIIMTMGLLLTQTMTGCMTKKNICNGGRWKPGHWSLHRRCTTICSITAMLIIGGNGSGMASRAACIYI